MRKYRVKPDDVDAVFYRGNNTREVENFLGKYLVEVTEVRDRTTGDINEEGLRIFDIVSKEWVDVYDDCYIVRHADGVVTIDAKEDFEARYVLAPSTGGWMNPHIPRQPGLPGTPIITYNNGDGLSPRVLAREVISAIDGVSKARRKI